MKTKTGISGVALSVILLSGCSTTITYPSKQSFDFTQPVSVQVTKAREMIVDYGAKGDELAATNDKTAFSNILWGTAMVTAAVYKAPKDVLSGLAIGTGANTITNNTFNVSGQLSIYQNATTALMCMRNEGEKLERLRIAAGATQTPGIKANIPTLQTFTSRAFKAQAAEPDPCTLFVASAMKKNEAVEKKKPKNAPDAPSEAEIKLAAQLKLACTVEMNRAEKAIQSFAAQNNQAVAIDPGRQMADQLQGLDTTVKQKLRGLLVVKDPGTIKGDMEKLVAAATAEQKAQDQKSEAGGAAKALKDMGVLDATPDLSAYNAQADYDAALIGFDAALTTCKAGSGI